MDISWQAGVAILDSALLLGSAVYALRQRAYRPQTALLAALYGVLAAGWALLHVLIQNGLLGGLQAEFVLRLPALGLLGLSVMFWLLTRMALGHSERLWIWALLGAVWVGLAAAAAMHLLPLPQALYFVGGISVSAANLLTGWLYLGLGLATLGSTMLALRYLRQSSRYFTVSSYWVIVLLVGVIGDLLYLWRPGLPGLVLRSVAAGLAVFVASSPRIPEVSHVLRHWLNRLLYSVLAFLVFTGLFALVGFVFKTRPDLPMLWIAGGMAILGALLVDPLLFRGRRMLRRWITGPGEPSDTSGLLRQYSQSITNILDLNLLATVAVATAAELLDVKRGFVFLVDHEKNAEGAVFQLRGVKGMGDTNPQPARLNETSPLAAYFRYEYKPITQAEIDTQTRFKDMPAVERLWLDRLGVEVFSPIYAKNEWIGLLALGAKGSGRAFSPRELGLLATISDQTAVALENIRLVEGLMRLNNDFRRSYSALDQANRSLERLDKTKSDFISIASHELRTPITLISGSSQMLLDDPELQKNPYYKQMLTKLAAGAQRLHEIVDSMLDAAKIDTRALDLEPQPVSLFSLVQSVAKDLKKEADERKQTIVMQDLEDLPPVAADQPALKKAFYHLLINAIKYTPDGGTITVTGQKLPPDDEKFRQGAVQVTVADTGIGIDPRFQELIFTKFYQTGELALHSTGKTKFKGGGPGLGLYITRGIIEAHRGNIWVESPGYSEQDCPGSKFHVALPLKKM
jgi:signal transduction histidine kinase